jgi:hypothetical protein
MNMKVYRLINPSDPYTFKAPSIEVAGVVACLLSTGFGAESEDDNDERTPVLFGWQEWLDDRGIDSKWVSEHSAEIADAYESFLIGGLHERADVESMLAALPPKKREKWRAERQDRHRTSLNQIGEAAYKMAKKFRKAAEQVA